MAGMLSGLERKTDDVRGYVAAADSDPGGVLIGDDTGFEKGGCRCT